MVNIKIIQNTNRIILIHNYEFHISHKIEFCNNPTIILTNFNYSLL